MIVSFSARAGGNCDRISEKIAEFHGGGKIFRFSEQQIHPCGGCRYECFRQDGICPYRSDPEYGLLESVCGSDLVYFVIPNYCDYPCAHYFIFQERSQCYFQGKPERMNEYLKIPKKFVVISNTNEDNFSGILSENAVNAPDILFLSAIKYGKVSISGDLTDSADAMNDLYNFLKGEK